MSTTPAASPWSRASTASRATRRCSARSSRWRTSSTAGRRAPTPTRATAPGSCSSSPTSCCAASSATSSRRAGRYGVAVCFLPQDDERRAELEALLTSTVEAEGQRVVGWRDVPVDKDYVGITANYFAPYIKQLVVAAGHAGVPGGPGRLRAQALRDPPRRRAGRRPGPRGAVVLEPHDRLQGHAHRPAAARLLPRPAGHADQDRARARPLALLDQHVPELGARAPVPLHRPQRRDQHAARQRQLDARARVAARLRAVRRGGPREAAADRAPGRLGLGDVRQRARAARAGGALAAPRGDDDDPGGLRGPRRPARAPARASTPSTPV